MIDIYIAGSSGAAERSRVHSVFERVRRMEGVHITHDWLAVVEMEEAKRELEPGQRYISQVNMEWNQVAKDCASSDLRGVWEATYFWVMLPKSGGAGLFMECGYSLLCPHHLMRFYTPFDRVERSIFLALPAFTPVESDEEMLQFLQEFG